MPVFVLNNWHCWSCLSIWLYRDKKREIAWGSNYCHASWLIDKMGCLHGNAVLVGTVAISLCRRHRVHSRDWQRMASCRPRRVTRLACNDSGLPPSPSGTPCAARQCLPPRHARVAVRSLGPRQTPRQCILAACSARPVPQPHVNLTQVSLSQGNSLAGSLSYYDWCMWPWAGRQLRIWFLTSVFLTRPHRDYSKGGRRTVTVTGNCPFFRFKCWRAPGQPPAGAGKTLKPGCSEQAAAAEWLEHMRA